MIPEDEANIIYSKLTLSCFSTIVKFLSKEVDLTEIDLGKTMSGEIVKIFLEDKIRFLENNNLSSNQLNHFVIEAYKTHILYNIAQMFSHFCSDNSRYLVNMIFDLLDFERVIYVNGHYALYKVTKAVIESQFQQGSKIKIILYPDDKKRDESLILNIIQCHKKDIVLLFKDDDDFRSNIVNLDVIRCFLESIGFVVEYKFVPM